MVQFSFFKLLSPRVGERPSFGNEVFSIRQDDVGHLARNISEILVSLNQILVNKKRIRDFRNRLQNFFEFFEN